MRDDRIVLANLRNNWNSPDTVVDSANNLQVSAYGPSPKDWDMQDIVDLSGLFCQENQNVCCSSQST